MSATTPARPLLVVHPARRVHRILSRTLSAMQRPVLTVESLAEAYKHLQASPELLFVEHTAFLSPEGQAFLDKAVKAGATSCLVLLTSGASKVEVSRLFQVSALANLVLEGQWVSLSENLVVTALKLLRRDIFGIEKYLAWGVEPIRRTLTHASDRRELVREMHDKLVTLGMGPRFSSIAVHITDELLSNAVFHPAVDGQGHHLRSNLARTEDFALSGRDRVDLAYACDGRYLAMAVRDRYGTLTQQQILDRLGANLEGTLRARDGKAGAGMGLALVYGYTSQLVFNIAPGEATEVIALLDVRQEQGLKESVAALNIFFAQHATDGVVA